MVMDQNKIKFIVAETTELHHKVSELYEALIDNEYDNSIKIIDNIRSKLLTIRKDLTGE